ncbi:MAG TPA: hypothetical protein VGY48_15590 [Vicinamibacterales bacterium]|nr:hypothetical protein [Vicinamibacterales bacterium]
MTFLDERRITADIMREIERAEKKHPHTENMPDGTRNGGMNLVCREQAQLSCDRATREGRVTFAQVLEEEFYEAICEEDKVKLRAELVQCGAVVIRWLAKLDREAGR